MKSLKFPKENQLFPIDMIDIEKLLSKGEEF